MAAKGLDVILELRPLFDLQVELAEILSLGRTPLGERRVINITGGTFGGERLCRRVRADGAADLDARYTLETDSGRLIQVQSRGLRHGPLEVLERLAAGEPVDPDRYYFRTVLRFETSAAELDWLNRVIAVARGARYRGPYF